MKMSVIIIAKNAKEQIKSAINSCSFANEVIVIDGGSEDTTIDISKELGAKVFNLKTNDFSQMRNFGLQKAEGEWILYVDSDEVVSEELSSQILQVIKSSNIYSAYKILRKNFYLGKNEWPKKEKLERLFLKENLVKWYGQLHESPQVKGLVGELSGYLDHYTHQNLKSMLEKTNEWSEVEANLRYKTNHPRMRWWRFPRVMIYAFFNSYIIQGGWKVGTVGLIESIYQAFSIFITYAKLWELQNQKNK